MRRPKLTPTRVEGLTLLADRVRPLAKARVRRGDLFSLTPAEAKQIRAAIKFVDDLKAWRAARNQPQPTQGELFS
jgi:hypothetical protein